MRHAAARIVRALTGPVGHGSHEGSFWRSAFTLMLLLVTLPVFLIGALAAAVVAAPLLLAAGVAEAARHFFRAPHARPLSLR